MIDKLKLYISAAPELRFERDLLARSMTEVPTSLGFTITQTPPADREPDLDAVAEAHMHVLLIGSDIQAPVGLEWATARRHSKHVLLLYKASVQHTQAAQAFVRDVAKVGAWQTFDDAVSLQRRMLRAVGDHLLSNRLRYDLADAELDALRAWRKTLDGKPKKSISDVRDVRDVRDVSGGAEQSAVILTAERFVPREGRPLGED